MHNFSAFLASQQCGVFLYDAHAPAAPSATDFILAELCAFAKAFRRGEPGAARTVAGASSDGSLGSATSSVQPGHHPRLGRAEGLSRCLLA